MIVMLPKKGKLLKTPIMANCEEVGGQGRELGGSGKESRGCKSLISNCHFL